MIRTAKITKSKKNRFFFIQFEWARANQHNNLKYESESRERDKKSSPNICRGVKETPRQHFGVVALK